MNAKRGYVPEDAKNFSASALETMRTASRHINYLINQGYFGCWNWRLFYLPKSSNISETLANESDRNTLKTLQEFNCSVGLPLFLETFERPIGNLVGKSPFS